MLMSNHRCHVAALLEALAPNLHEMGDAPLHLEITIGNTRCSLTVESAFPANAVADHAAGALQLTAEEVRLVAAARARAPHALGSRQRETA